MEQGLKKSSCARVHIIKKKKAELCPQFTSLHSDSAYFKNNLTNLYFLNVIHKITALVQNIFFFNIYARSFFGNMKNHQHKKTYFQNF